MTVPSEPTHAEVTVEVRPCGAIVTLQPGESLLAGARRAGMRWPSLCGGNANCLTCAVTVVHGAPRPPVAAERRALVPLQTQHPGEVRLACQLRTDEPLVVHQPSAKAGRAPTVDSKPGDASAGS